MKGLNEEMKGWESPRKAKKKKNEISFKIWNGENRFKITTPTTIDTRCHLM